MDENINAKTLAAKYVVLEIAFGKLLAELASANGQGAHEARQFLASVDELVNRVTAIHQQNDPAWAGAISAASANFSQAVLTHFNAFSGDNLN